MNKPNLILIVSISLLIGCVSDTRSKQIDVQANGGKEKKPIVYQAPRNTGNFKCNKIKGLSYPPFKHTRYINFTINELKALNISKIRISPNWKNREPQKGRFNWEPFDEAIHAAQNNNISILLTIPSIGPSWACSEIKNKKGCVFADEDDFRNYVTTLLTRYPGVFEMIQFGNEWELHYPGEMSDFVRFNNLLFDTVKQISPDTKVVLGGITRAYPIVELQCHQMKSLDFSGMIFKEGYSEEKLRQKIKKEYCYKGIRDKVAYVFRNAKYDILDIHLYDDYKNWRDYIALLPQEKPIIVSEFGGPSSVFEIETDDYQARQIEAYIKTIESLPIEEAYYFKLVDSKHSYHKHTGLFNEKMEKKPSYYIFSNCTQLK